MEELTKEEIFGQAIRRCREKKNLTQEELALLTRVSTVHIGSIERGKTKTPSFWLILSIAEQLGVSVYEFTELQA